MKKPDELFVNLTVGEVARLLEGLRSLGANLTATQTRCTELLLENRQLRTRQVRFEQLEVATRKWLKLWQHEGEDDFTTDQGFPGVECELVAAIDGLDDGPPSPDEQHTVAAWARKLFGERATDVGERTVRFIEEAVELARALGASQELIHNVVDYVYARAKGTPSQEIGGVMVTLYALAEAIGARVDDEAAKEIDRIHRPEVIERCQRRQAEKRRVLQGGAL